MAMECFFFSHPPPPPVYLPFWGGVKCELGCNFNPYRSGTKLSPSLRIQAGLGEGGISEHICPCIQAFLDPSLLSARRMQGTKAREDWGGATSGLPGELLVCFPPLSCAWDPWSWSDLFYGIPGAQGCWNYKIWEQQTETKQPCIKCSKYFSKLRLRATNGFYYLPPPYPQVPPLGKLALSGSLFWLPVPFPITSKSLSRASQGKDSIKVPFCLLCFWPAVVDS